MRRAAEEVKLSKQPGNDGFVECGVSVDGTWQKRGYSSLNGCVTALSIETGKVLDLEVMSSFCNTCRKLERLPEDTEERLELEPHQCSSNYKGSAPNMEPVGAYRIFERAPSRHGIRYMDYYGDGDSKSFLRVEDIYEGKEVRKLECIGHVQKRVGCRLRKLKKVVKGLGGKGKLTDMFIDRLQNYYGIAIRSNVGDFNGMRQAVIAAFFHCVSRRDKPLHGQCPQGKDSWCSYQKCKADGCLEMYKPKAGLPDAVINKVKPVYMELCEEKLLRKCLHGKTQNANESFNGVLWQRLPKSNFVGLNTFMNGASDAVMQFNEGFIGLLCVFRGLDIDPGYYTVQGYTKLDNERVTEARRLSTPAANRQRKIRRAQRKKKNCTMKLKKG
ncbi:uncharacterized protein LOC135384970 [Ornithodoros turicata]|uniref:uncharacterized protein LOC135384970 n=1 Tax=Ornithodoros turicata TaxID=34597 RepID=UPI0031397A81